MADMSAKGSIAAGVLAAIGASVCCVGPLVLLALGISGAWVSNLTALEALSTCFHRPNARISRIRLSAALSGSTGMHTRRAMRRPQRHEAATPPVLARYCCTACTGCDTLARAPVLLKGLMNA